MTDQIQALLDSLARHAEARALRDMPVQPVRHVLWWFGDRETGLQPGGRDEALLELLTRGDDDTIDSLLLSVHEPMAHLTMAWLLGREEGGLDRLREKIRHLRARDGGAVRHGRDALMTGLELVKVLDVVCPDCQAQAGDPCTAPTDTGRRVVTWVHIARLDLHCQTIAEGVVVPELQHRPGPSRSLAEEYENTRIRDRARELAAQHPLPHAPSAKVVEISARARVIADQFGCTPEAAERGIRRGWLK